MVQRIDILDSLQSRIHWPYLAISGSRLASENDCARLDLYRVPGHIETLIQILVGILGKEQ